MSKILFHHIPKTAGSALVQHAQALFGDDVCPARYDQDLLPGMIEDARYTFYHGHFSRAVVERFRRTVPDGFVFTFLRHPYARVLSQYQNWIDGNKVARELALIEERYIDHPHLQVLRVKFQETIFHMSLDAFLTSTDRDVRHVASNLQAQYLSDEDDPHPIRFEKAVVSAMMTYDFVGVQELYAPCLRIIEAKCMLPAGSLGGAEKVNTSEDVKVDGCYDVTPSQLRLLEEANAYDLAVYHAFYAQLLRYYADQLPATALDIATTVALPPSSLETARLAG